MSSVTVCVVVDVAATVHLSAMKELTLRMQAMTWTYVQGEVLSLGDLIA